MHSDLLGEVMAQFEMNMFDKDKMRMVLDEKEAKLKEFKSLAIDKLAEFHAILTPTQRAELVKKLKKHKEGCDMGKCSM